MNLSSVIASDLTLIYLHLLDQKSTLIHASFFANASDTCPCLHGPRNSKGWFHGNNFFTYFQHGGMTIKHGIIGHQRDLETSTMSIYR